MKRGHSWCSRANLSFLNSTRRKSAVSMRGCREGVKSRRGAALWPLPQKILTCTFTKLRTCQVSSLENKLAMADGVSLYKQLEPFAEVAGLAIGDPVGQRFSSTEQQQYTTITTIGHEC